VGGVGENQDSGGTRLSYTAAREQADPCCCRCSPPLHVAYGWAAKVNRVETSEEIPRERKHAEKDLGRGRVHFIHPDCGFWMLKRSVADRKIAALAKGRDLYLGRA
jgi:hypothetical protein